MARRHKCACGNRTDRLYSVQNSKVTYKPDHTHIQYTDGLSGVCAGCVITFVTNTRNQRNMPGYEDPEATEAPRGQGKE